MPAEPDAPAAAYISAAIPPGSINHFVLLMTAKELRPVVAASIALAEVIGNIPRQGIEPEVQQLKLSWWLEEIEMIGRDKARHPLSIELSRLLSHPAWLDPLHALVRGAFSDTGDPNLMSLTDLLPHCHRVAERQTLIASVLPHCDELALSHARSVGVGIGLTEVIRDRSEGGRRIPQSELDGTTGPVTAAQLATIAHDHFRAAKPMPVEQRRAQSSLLLQAALYRRLLDRLQRHDYDSGKAAMRPLALLWQAWREARTLIK